MADELVPEQDPTIESIRAEIAKSEPTTEKRAFKAFVLAILGSIPWLGGFLTAAAAFKFEEAGDKQDTLQTQWLEEHQKKLLLLKATLEEMYTRFEKLGDSIDERIQSEEYLGVIRKAFRIWDEADTEEKRRMVANVVTNAAGTRVCSDDILRLFLDWLQFYHEAHLTIIREIFYNPGSTRLEIWNAIYGAIPREDSAEVDLYKRLIRDLSTGDVIRQERDTNRLGQFLRKRPLRVKRGQASQVMKSAFDDTENYVLTELGNQFVHYAMTELVTRLQQPGDQPEG